MAGRSGDVSVADASLAPRWRCGRMARNAQPFIFGLNAALRQAGDKAAYPIRVDIIVTLLGPVRYMFVDLMDAAELPLIEQIVTERAAGRAVMAGQVTSTRELRIVMYTPDQGWAADVENALGARIAAHQVRVTSGPDPRWRGYRDIEKLRRRGRVNSLVALFVLPLLWGLALGIRFGAGWGLVAAFFVLSWLVPALAPQLAGGKRQDSIWADGRGQISRQISRMVRWPPGLAFGYYAYVMTTLLLPFSAVFLGSRLSAWWCAAIAAGVGLVITGAIWSAQRQYFAELKARTLAP